MDLIDYVRAIRKRKWMVVLGIILCTGVAIVVALRLPEKYQAEATLLIEGSIIPGDRETQALSPRTIQNLGTTYQRIVMRQEILREAIEKLGVDDSPHELTWQALRERVSAQPVRGSQLIAVRVTLQDPELARDLANFLAERAVEQATELGTRGADKRRQVLKEKVDQARRQLEQAEMDLLRFEKTAEIELVQHEISNRLAQIRVLGYMQLASRHLGDGEAYGIPVSDLIPEAAAIEKDVERLRAEAVRLQQDLHEKEMKQGELERERSLRERRYIRWSAKYDDVSIQVACRTQGLKLGDRAVVPVKPSEPDRKMIVAGTGFLSFFFFIFLASFLEFLAMEWARKEDETAEEAAG